MEFWVFKNHYLKKIACKNVKTTFLEKICLKANFFHVFQNCRKCRAMTCILSSLAKVSGEEKYLPVVDANLHHALNKFANKKSQQFIEA